MANNSKITQKYISKLRNHEESEVPEVWNNISSQLKKKLFFKFSWHYFNIYHLVLIGSAVALVITGIVYQIEPDSKKDVTSPISKDSVAKNEATVPLISEEDKKQNTIVKDIKKQDKETTSLKSDTTNTKTQEIITQKTDTLQTTKKSTLLPNKLEIKKPVVILRKRDTIIDIDTIKTYKRKKRR